MLNRLLNPRKNIVIYQLLLATNIILAIIKFSTIASLLKELDNKNNKNNKNNEKKVDDVDKKD